MTRLADTVAAELAQRAWIGIDGPNAESLDGIRLALHRVLPTLSLEDVGEWAQPALRSLSSADNGFSFEARFVGAVAAALILGAKLQETHGT